MCLICEEMVCNICSYVPHREFLMGYLLIFSWMCLIYEEITICWGLYRPHNEYLMKLVLWSFSRLCFICEVIFGHCVRYDPQRASLMTPPWRLSWMCLIYKNIKPLRQIHPSNGIPHKFLPVKFFMNVFDFWKKCHPPRQLWPS